MKLSALTRAGVVLGLGLGGFFDGIVLHQILGWHHMICTTATCQATSIEHLKQQNTQDGFFHLAMWILTLVGVALLYRAGLEQRKPRSGKELLGGMLAGWGAFNLLEGLINHQILGLHHVRPGHANEFAFDMLFLASGLLLLAVGWGVVRSSHRSKAPPYF